MAFTRCLFQVEPVKEALLFVFDPASVDPEMGKVMEDIKQVIFCGRDVPFSWGLECVYVCNLLMLILDLLCYIVHIFMLFW